VGAHEIAEGSTLLGGSWLDHGDFYTSINIDLKPVHHPR
jgi:hypothetical protein